MEMDSLPPAIPTLRARADRFGSAAAAVIATVMLYQILFLMRGCTWDISSDEAEFWTWSQRLDWSYFARGPLIAWLIWLSGTLFGELSQRLNGSLMLATRLPAVLLGGLTAWGVFRLAERVSDSRRAGFLAVLLLPVVPVLAIGATLMTCDTPLVCCWTWAAVWSLRAVESNRLCDWTAVGLLSAVGVLAKYTMLAFPASLMLFLALGPRHRHLLTGPGFWTSVALCLGLGLGPILVWNLNHHWVGAGQLADRLGLSVGSHWGSALPVLFFLGGDFASLGGIWWIAGLFAINHAANVAWKVNPAFDKLWSARQGPSQTERAHSGLAFLLCQWGIIWTACLAASMAGETEANWMAAGHLALVVLIGVRIDSILTQRSPKSLLYLAAWCVSLAGVVVIHHTDWFYPSLADMIPPSTKSCPAPLRIYDPTARMRGHRVLSQAVGQRLAAFQSGDLRPFVLTPTYGLASSLCFYLPDHPETYCLSWNYGMTAHPVNQHDLWHPNPRHDADVFKGRPAIVVEDANAVPSYARQLVRKGIFGRAETEDQIVVREHGVVVGVWNITVCHDYRGLAGFHQNRVLGERVARR